jgi:cytochrome c oxidase subunit IV
MSTQQAIQSHGDATSHTDGHDHGAHVSSLITIYIVLMFLLVLTVAAAYLDIGKTVHFDSLNIIIAMVIAVIKAAFVLWVFMHVKYNSRLVQVFAFSAFFWLGIMLTLTFGDYFTRNGSPGDTRDMVKRSEEYISEPHHRYPQTDLQHPETVAEEVNPVTH